MSLVKMMNISNIYVPEVLRYFLFIDISFAIIPICTNFAYVT